MDGMCHEHQRDRVVVEDGRAGWNLEVKETTRRPAGSAVSCMTMTMSCPKWVGLRLRVLRPYRLYSAGVLCRLL
jgi:hypothetical protein